MRHRKAGRKLGRTIDQRRALLRSLVRELVRHERITTTEARAKEARVLAEKLISYGKEGGLHKRRVAMSRLPDPQVVKKVFDELAPRYANRPGGYSRVLRLGPRQGDGAPMVMLELV